MPLRDIIIILKTSLSYLLFGRRRPQWDLQMQIFCDVARYYTGLLFPESHDDNIEDIRFEDLDAHFKNYPLPTFTVDPGIGVSISLEIDVRDVDIDKDKLAGFGLGEASFCSLIDKDKATAERGSSALNSSCGRLIPYELISPRNIDKEYENLFNGEENCKALDPHPLSENEKIILYFHGGSYVLGGPSSHCEHVAHICKITRLRAFVIDYRLAPLNPYPAQLHDSLISFIYLLNLGYKPSNIILVGDSAGGHLSLCLFRLLRHGFLQKDTRLCGIILISPMPGLSMTGKSLHENQNVDYIVPVPTEWPTSPIRLFYRPGHKCTPEYLSELESPSLTPVNGLMAGMPPTLIQMGACEVMVDDVRLLFERIKSDNPDIENQIIYEEYPGMFHVFHRLLHIKDTKEAFEGIASFVGSLKD